MELVEIDYETPTTLSEAFNGVDKLFLNTPFQPDIAELTLTEAAKSGTVEHIVKLAVLGAEAEPSISMPGLHRQAEKKIEESGLPYTFWVQVVLCKILSISLVILSNLRLNNEVFLIGLEKYIVRSKGR